MAALNRHDRALLATLATGRHSTSQLAAVTGHGPRILRIQLARLWATGAVTAHTGPDRYLRWTATTPPRGRHRAH